MLALKTTTCRMIISPFQVRFTPDGVKINIYNMCCGSNFGKNFQTILILFPFVSDYGNEYCTKENKN